jgi:hypothetical protein
MVIREEARRRGREGRGDRMGQLLVRQTTWSLLLIPQIPEIMQQLPEIL